MVELALLELLKLKATALVKLGHRRSYSNSPQISQLHRQWVYKKMHKRTIFRKFAGNLMTKASSLK